MRKRGWFIGAGLVLAAFVSLPFVGVFAAMGVSSAVCTAPGVAAVAGAVDCSQVSAIGWHLPLGPGYRIGDRYGMRFHPIYHAGVDLPDRGGAPIYAVHAGTVIWAGRNGGLGNYVAIDHGNGIVTGYGHMSVVAATKGDLVEAGQVIGYVGATGDATGNHLHFLVKVDGKFVDPIPFMASVGVPLE
jgi:murein DD-endopeptidase MepM/ murein hydrolase activator NlpD